MLATRVLHAVLPDLDDVMYRARQEKRRCWNGSPVHNRGKSKTEPPTSKALNEELVATFELYREDTSVVFCH